ncbi:Uncharacterised protein [Suttonella ornithocola]|uniref:Uncharacterized protein n=2 Tax=Suttonella ornithocola TaxID=279832 RepID=A0A380MWW5_9GAMM|nr:Uncharacterised protein [Suttonella ornithocola]
MKNQNIILSKTLKGQKNRKYTVNIHQMNIDKVKPPHKCKNARSFGIIFSSDYPYLEQLKTDFPKLSLLEAQKIEDERVYDEALDSKVFYHLTENGQIELSLQYRGFLETPHDGFLGYLVGCEFRDQAELELNEMSHFLNHQVYSYSIPGLKIKSPALFCDKTEIDMLLNMAQAEIDEYQRMFALARDVVSDLSIVIKTTGDGGFHFRKRDMRLLSLACDVINQLLRLQRN